MNLNAHLLFLLSIIRFYVSGNISFRLQHLSSINVFGGFRSSDFVTFREEQSHQDCIQYAFRHISRRVITPCRANLRSSIKARYAPVMLRTDDPDLDKPTVLASVREIVVSRKRPWQLKDVPLRGSSFFFFWAIERMCAQGRPLEKCKH